MKLTVKHVALEKSPFYRQRDGGRINKASVVTRRVFAGTWDGDLTGLDRI